MPPVPYGRHSFFTEWNEMSGFSELHRSIPIFCRTCFICCSLCVTYSGVSGQAVQPVPLASLKLSMAVYGQKLDGRPSI